MKRLLLIAAAASIAMFGAMSLASADEFVLHDDPFAMTALEAIDEAVIFDDVPLTARMIIAVDNSIQAICTDTSPGAAPYQRPGGFCDAVASNKSMVPQGDGSCLPQALPGEYRYCEPPDPPALS